MKAMKKIGDDEQAEKATKGKEPAPEKEAETQTFGAPPPPKEPGTEGVGDEGSAASKVSDAKASGKLKPLEDLMTEQGWDMDAGEALLLAQKTQAPGTQRKSPADLAQMMRDDPGIYKDLQALQPGGALDDLEQNGTTAMEKKAKAGPAAPPPKEPDGDEAAPPPPPPPAMGVDDKLRDMMKKKKAPPAPL